MSVLSEQIKELSLAEKIQLVQDLWDDIATSTEELPLTPSQVEELDHRLIQHKDNPDDVSAWADVRQRILDK
ncbi:addiction module protein [[Limnothrix rosea] IAM M-220]|uniref:addiction module protein n=1 Tax=[Limnothrix rosea] IAM M-220 TaxID=454133 RepID=UPI000958F111|nr:addiction module protein [[Limnothrix rosea] IAM M-220]OKH17496.1 hypothetical protein NIES208_09145 [[Limnothrix rosea] IAM M-220]